MSVVNVKTMVINSSEIKNLPNVYGGSCFDELREF